MLQRWQQELEARDRHIQQLEQMQQQVCQLAHTCASGGWGLWLLSKAEPRPEEEGEMGGTQAWDVPLPEEVWVNKNWWSHLGEGKRKPIEWGE